MEAEAEPAPLSRWRVFSVAAFRRWWIAQGISVIADQMMFIGLPWLTLKLTDDGTMTGLVLATAGIPRVVFMILGGVVTDRYSPLTVVALSNFVRSATVLFFPIAILGGFLELWMIFAVALVFGTSDAFFYPAQIAIMPRLVDKDLLAPANALSQGTNQISNFAGPATAGLVIAYLGRAFVDDLPVETPDMAGLSIVFGSACIVFALAGTIVASINSSVLKTRALSGETATKSAINEIIEGVRYAFREKILAALIPILALINFFTAGPFVVGMARFADTRFEDGAAAFGLLEASIAGGAVFGIIMAGVLPRPSKPGPIFMSTASIMGFGLIAIAFVHDLPTALAIQAVGGAFNGYVNVMYLTWMQQFVPSHLLGRVSALMMTASYGLAPLSFAVTGFLIDIDLMLVFIVSGALMAACTLGSLLIPVVRNMPYDREIFGEEASPD